MEKTRFEMGMEQLQKIDGAGGEDVIQSFQDISRTWGEIHCRICLGDIYTRED